MFSPLATFRTSGIAKLSRARAVDVWPHSKWRSLLQRKKNSAKNRSDRFDDSLHRCIVVIVARMTLISTTHTLRFVVTPALFPFSFFPPLIALFSPRFVRIVARESREFLVVVVQGIHEESTRNALGLCMSEAPYASNRLFFSPFSAAASSGWSQVAQPAPNRRRTISPGPFHMQRTFKKWYIWVLSQAPGKRRIFRLMMIDDYAFRRGGVQGKGTYTWATRPCSV